MFVHILENADISRWLEFLGSNFEVPDSLSGFLDTADCKWREFDRDRCTGSRLNIPGQRITLTGLKATNLEVYSRKGFRFDPDFSRLWVGGVPVLGTDRWMVFIGLP